MTSIVIHYKGTLKRKNRPWFIQLLVRNLKTALAGLHVATVRSVMGRIEAGAPARTPWEEVRAAVAHLRYRDFSYQSGSARVQGARLGDPRRRR
jgi:adenylyl- and sulfurtransferase ThiI